MADKSNMAKYSFSMKKTLILLSAVLTFTCIPSQAVEFGTDATGDPNVMKVGGGSGFLYSERIVLTVAHVIEQTGGLNYWNRNGVVYNPGIASIVGQKQYKVKQVIIPETYVTPDYRNNIIKDDLAIIILSEDVPIQKKAVLATEEQMKRFVAEKSKVELVGYGFTNGSQRSMTWPELMNKPPNKLTSTLISPEMVTEFYKQYPKVDWTKINKPGVYGIIQHRELQQSHICDGDSGSVFFVEENNVKYVLGTTGLGLVNNNCPPPNNDYPFPSMSWIDPNSRLAEFLKIAEKIVVDDKQKEFAQAEELRVAAENKSKQEADAKAKLEADAKAKLEADAKAKLEAEASKKTSISCLKGKIKKRVLGINPKCPAGFKKI